MATVPCPDCGAQISRSAKTCPSCGRPRSAGALKAGCIGCFGFLAVMLVLGWVITAVESFVGSGRAPTPPRAESSATDDRRFSIVGLWDSDDAANEWISFDGDTLTTYNSGQLRKWAYTWRNSSMMAVMFNGSLRDWSRINVITADSIWVCNANSGNCHGYSRRK